MASTLTAPIRHTAAGGAVDLTTAGHRLAVAQLAQEVTQYLADRLSLRRFCQFAGDISGAGSNTGRQLYAQIGFGQTASSLSEGGSLSPSTVTVDYTDVQVGERGIEWDETFLAQITGRPGLDLSLEQLAALAADTYEATFAADVASLIATASSSVGSTGVDMSMDDWYDAIYFHHLQDGQDGQLAAVLHGRQIADLAESKRGEPAEWTKATNQRAWTGDSFQGELGGVPVVKCNRITASGGDRHGGMFSARAMRYMTAQAALPRIRGLSSRALIVPDPGIVIDFGSTFGTVTSKLMLYFVYGMSIGDQGQKEIVRISTDQ